MAHYQLPPLKEEKRFEEFVCDLFNAVEKTESFVRTDYQTFGVKGQKQKGIDIYSGKTYTAIQCKVKDIRGREEDIRQTLKNDIVNDLSLASMLHVTVKRFIFASTFRDDAHLQEFVNIVKAERELSYEIYYWGWDTLSRYAEGQPSILKKYFATVTEHDKKTELEPSFMLRITSGKQLVEIISSVDAYRFDHDDIATEDEGNLLGVFFENLEDYGDLMGMGEFSFSRKMELGITFSGYLKDLEELGFFVFGERKKEPMPSEDNRDVGYWDVAEIHILRKTNPGILNYGESK
ncbi:hypothetical protein PV783_24695 [Chitinophaga sp. CC14]|uniref:hypothetical protein n=1 Tax=Chitinophaga sp. CC14 TaxID=3029199 RepID=UPI003B810C18